MYSEGGRLTQGISRRRFFHSLSKRHMCGPSQVKPDSSRATFKLGKRSKTPSETILVTWVAKTPAMSTYSSMKYEGQPVGVGGTPGTPPNWRPATRLLRAIA